MKNHKNIYARFIKRTADILMSLSAIIILSPVLLTVALLVKINHGSPVIFKQERPGKDEKSFTIYKFRTMTNRRDDTGNLLPDHERLTDFGNMLRNTSLDELPELWNILKGDMSFVGPRPHLFDDLLFMSPQQRQRHSVRPGLTGLAQVNGRNSISWDDKFNHDLQYIDNISFIGDFRIILKTAVIVFRQEGIREEGMATSENYGDYLLREGKITKYEYILYKNQGTDNRQGVKADE
jgi:undecaprenyl phosphate N,N'-diacetylbacillosamine 1-phosphate transferase